MAGENVAIIKGMMDVETCDSVSQKKEPDTLQRPGSKNKPKDCTKIMVVCFSLLRLRSPQPY